jgi:hypothetical protein
LIGAIEDNPFFRLSDVLSVKLSDSASFDEI